MTLEERVALLEKAVERAERASEKARDEASAARSSGSDATTELHSIGRGLIDHVEKALGARAKEIQELVSTVDALRKEAAEREVRKAARSQVALEDARDEAMRINRNARWRRWGTWSLGIVIAVAQVVQFVLTIDRTLHP